MTEGTTIPADRRYSEEHTWAKRDGDSILVGITDFAQRELGDIVFVELPAAGAKVEASREFGVIESVKTASDLFSPISGTVLAVNQALAEQPDLVNDSPYDRGWMIRVVPDDPASLDGLLDAPQYRQLIEG